MSRHYFFYITLFLCVLSVAIGVCAGDRQDIVKHRLDVNPELSLPNEFLADLVDNCVNCYSEIVNSRPGELAYCRTNALDENKKINLNNIISDLNKIKLLNFSLYEFITNNKNVINCFVNYTYFYGKNTIGRIATSIMNGETLWKNRKCTDFKLDFLKDCFLDHEMNDNRVSIKSHIKRLLKVMPVFFGSASLSQIGLIQRSIGSLVDPSKIGLKHQIVAAYLWSPFVLYFNSKISVRMVNGILSEIYNAPQNSTTYRKLKITKNFLNKSQHVRDIFYGGCSRYVINSALYDQMIKDPLASEIVTSLGSIVFQRTNFKKLLNNPLGVDITLLSFQEEASQIPCLYDHIIEFRCPDVFEFDFVNRYDVMLKGFVEYLSTHLGKNTLVKVVVRNNRNVHTLTLYEDFLKILQSHSIVANKKMKILE